MWSRSATPGGGTSPLAGEVDLHDIRRWHVVLLDDIRDVTARYGLVPSTEVIGGPAIPRGRCERHDPGFAADGLRQRQRHESLVGAHVPYGFTVANEGRNNLDTTSLKCVGTICTAYGYRTQPHVSDDARVNTNGHTSEDPLSCVTDGERQLHGGSIGTFPSMYSSS